MIRVGCLPRVNPFSTRFVEPGAIPFQFPTSYGRSAILQRLTATGGWGEIVGPHGSGKSTLLADLLPALRVWHLRHLRLNSTHRVVPPWVWTVPPVRSLLIIDGYEQLGFLTRRWVKWHCRRHGSGLLVTAHRSMGLPTLYRTDMTTETASKVITGLIPPGGEWVLNGFDIAARLQHHHGSLRDVLFELYDRWNLGERGCPPSERR